MTADGLEARYRRLLRWYPADHRARHRDEMLGVLMAAAEPGRDRPGLGDSADLLMGATRIRLRPGRALSDRAGWRDTLAVFSLGGPVLMLAATIIAWLGGLVWSYLGHGAGLMLRLDVADSAYGKLEGAHPAVATVMWLLLVSQGIVTVLALAGLRRCAAVAAALYVLYFGRYLVIEWTFPGAYLGIAVLMPLQFVAPLTSLVALLASEGPRRGRKLMQRRHWAYLAAGSLVGAALIEQLNIFVIDDLAAQSVFYLFAVAATAAVALALVAAWLSSAHGKRLAVAFGVVAFSAFLQAAQQYLIPGPGGLTAANLLLPGCEVLALCVLAGIIYRTWRRGSRSPAVRATALPDSRRQPH
jgi:hypothetical protein